MWQLRNMLSGAQGVLIMDSTKSILNCNTFFLKLLKEFGFPRKEQVSFLAISGTAVMKDLIGENVHTMCIILYIYILNQHVLSNTIKALATTTKRQNVAAILKSWIPSTLQTWQLVHMATNSLIRIANNSMQFSTA